MAYDFFENTGEWMTTLNSYESAYNRKREEFNKKVQLYTRQHRFATVVKEDELLEMLTELKRLKDEMLTIRDAIMKKSKETIENPVFITFRS